MWTFPSILLALAAAPAGPAPTLTPSPALPAVDPSPSTTWYVDASSTPPGNGSLSSPFFSVTYALAQPQVVSGDRISVAPGEYLFEELDYDGKDVVIESQAGPDVTRLVAPPSFGLHDLHPVVRIENGEVGAVLRGFELTGGTGAGNCTNFTEVVGGAVTVCGSAARIEDCVFITNTAERGGAIYAASSRLNLSGCVFRGPGSNALGEALYAVGSALVVHDCSFEDLRIAPQGLPAGEGAVVIDQSTAHFTECTFLRNATRLFGAHLWTRSSDVTVESSLFSVATGYAGASIAALGGTLHLSGCVVESSLSISTQGAGLFASGADVTLDRCLFRDNEVQGRREGGAIALQTSDLLVTDSAFLGNRSDLGGAIHIGDLSRATVRGSLFEDNIATRGGGAVASSGGQFLSDETIFRGNQVIGSAPGTGPGGAVLGDSLLVRCTLTGNSAQEAGGASGAATLIGSIAWGNTPTDLDVDASAERSIVGDPGGATINETVDANPLFFGPRDQHVLPGSPAIDALPVEFPLDGDGSRAEIGAVTYSPWHCGTECADDFQSDGCTSNLNSILRVAGLDAFGSNKITDDRLLVTASFVPPGSFGLLAASMDPGLIQIPGSASPLCLGGPLLRLQRTLGAARPDGTLGMHLPLSSGPLGALAAAGQTWHLQLWYRDPIAGGTTTNTTSSISVPLR